MGDHHCPWLGQCIGRRNYRWFLNFIFTVPIVCSYVALLCLVHFILAATEKENHLLALANGFAKAPLAFPLMLFVSVIGTLVGGLAIFHAVLISKAVTTNERIKKTFADHRNPYDLGIVRNFLFSFFPPYQPRYSHLREYMQPGDLAP